MTTGRINQVTIFQGFSWSWVSFSVPPLPNLHFPPLPRPVRSQICSLSSVKKKVHANRKQPGGAKEEKTALFLLSHSLCRKAKERDEKKLCCWLVSVPVWNIGKVQKILFFQSEKKSSKLFIVSKNWLGFCSASFPSLRSYFFIHCCVLLFPFRMFYWSSFFFFQSRSGHEKLPRKKGERTKKG